MVLLDTTGSGFPKIKTELPEGSMREEAISLITQPILLESRPSLIVSLPSLHTVTPKLLQIALSNLFVESLEAL